MRVRWLAALLLALSSLLAMSCGPDKYRCTGSRESFTVVLRLPQGELPADTEVVVRYGGSSVERYVMSVGDVGHDVVFCKPADARGNELELPDAGAVSSAEALSCDLWTGGFTKLYVQASGVEPTEYELLPQEDRCTVLRTIVLDVGDAG